MARMQQPASSACAYIPKIDLMVEPIIMARGYLTYCC